MLRGAVRFIILLLFPLLCRRGLSRPAAVRIRRPDAAVTRFSRDAPRSRRRPAPSRPGAAAGGAPWEARGCPVAAARRGRAGSQRCAPSSPRAAPPADVAPQGPARVGAGPPA